MTFCGPQCSHQDPCVIFESRSLYQMSGPVVLSDRIQPVGKAILRAQGKDAAIVTWGTMVRVALEAADELKREGISRQRSRSSLAFAAG